MEGVGRPTPGLSRAWSSLCKPGTALCHPPLLFLGRLRGPGSSVLPGGLVLCTLQGPESQGQRPRPAGRAGCRHGPLAPVTAQRTSHRGVSPGAPAGSAAAAVRLGPAVSGAGEGKAGLDEGRGRSHVPGGGSKAGPRAPPLRGPLRAGQVPPSGLGAEMPWGCQPRQVPGGPRGCAPVPAALANLPLAACELPRPLSHLSPGPCVSCPCCPSRHLPPAQSR